MAFLALVHVHDGLCVDGQVLVRVHNHTEEARICLEKYTEERDPQNVDQLNFT